MPKQSEKKITQQLQTDPAIVMMKEMEQLIEDLEKIIYEDYENHPKKMKAMFNRLVHMAKKHKSPKLVSLFQMLCVKLNINADVDERSGIKWSLLAERLQGWYDNRMADHRANKVVLAAWFAGFAAMFSGRWYILY